MRKGFAILFFVLFIIIFPGALFSFNLKRTVLNPIFYKNTFRKIDFYNRVSKIDPQKIVDYVESKQTQDVESVNADQIAMVLTFLPPKEMQTFVETNIDPYTKNSAKGISGEVDLTGVKTALLSKNLDAETREMVLKMPDTYTPPQTTSWLNKYVSFVPISKIFSYFGFGFSILCLILSFILYSSWKGRLRMSGIILLIFGILATIGYAIVRPITVPSNFVADFLNGIASDLTLYAKNAFLRLYLIEGLSMVGLGTIFLTLSFFVSDDGTAQKKSVKIATNSK